MAIQPHYVCVCAYCADYDERAVHCYAILVSQVICSAEYQLLPAIMDPYIVQSLTKTNIFYLVLHSINKSSVMMFYDDNMICNHLTQAHLFLFLALFLMIYSYKL